MDCTPVRDTYPKKTLCGICITFAHDSARFTALWVVFWSVSQSNAEPRRGPNLSNWSHCLPFFPTCTKIARRFQGCLGLGASYGSARGSHGFGKFIFFLVSCFLFRMISDQMPHVLCSASLLADEYRESEVHTSLPLFQIESCYQERGFGGKPMFAVCLLLFFRRRAIAPDWLRYQRR
ncbi:hypothetical protein BDV95DRAFT_123028 [Massariosphaeria phaeospora]|uniref:Uncharacterized protein n=1 Tax=Massariosphaeria phaeospora TaxID=100035 RepID=A0A7C8I203_9PLEO|nr:hypothetical protein BDV95DRAFT_123028 [Massariosphaeria phaeospora]